MIFSFGDIYYVNFDPSFGHEYQGKRPAMVIQEEKFSEVITVVPITSRLSQLKHHDVLIQKDDRNNLTSDSVIKMHHINSYDKKRFLHYIGKAGSPVVRQVRGHLRRHFWM